MLTLSNREYNLECSEHVYVWVGPLDHTQMYHPMRILLSLHLYHCHTDNQ